MGGRVRNRLAAAALGALLIWPHQAGAQGRETTAAIAEAASKIQRDALIPPTPEAMFAAGAKAMRELLPSEIAARAPVQVVANEVDLLRLLGRLNDGWRGHEDELADAAISGMALAAHPRNGFLTAKAFQDLRGLAPPPADLSPASIGLTLTQKDGATVVGEGMDGAMPAWKGGARPGDILLAIDGAPVSGQTLESLIGKLRGAEGSTIRLSLTREGRPFELDLIRRISCVCGIDVRSVGDVVLLRVGSMGESTARTLERQIQTQIQASQSKGQRIDGYVLDLRGSPGGLFDASVGLADLFLDGSEIVTQRGRNANDIERYNARRGDILNGAPMVVLVGPQTAAGAEILAAALQDRRRATLVGAKTYGQGSIQTLLPLRNGRSGALKITTSQVFSPSGRALDGTGVQPDQAVAEAGAAGDVAADLRALEAATDDTQLAHALRLLRDTKPPK